MLQVVGLLQAHGFVTTTRGRTGGLCLAGSPAEISIGEVFRVFEADVPFAECFARGANTCPLTACCRLWIYLTRALDAFYHELDMVTLEDLVKGNCGLAALLALSPAARMRQPSCQTRLQKLAPDSVGLTGCEAGYSRQGRSGGGSGC